MAKRSKRYWLFKSDQASFSLEDLRNAPGARTAWDGVRNYQARNFLRDEVRPGDGVLVYHSGTGQPAVVGLAEVASEAQVDPTQFDPRDEHHDPDSPREAPRWYLVELRAVEALARPVSLAELKADPLLAAMLVVQRGQRLSIQPVEEAHWRRVLELGRGAGGGGGRGRGRAPGSRA